MVKLHQIRCLLVLTYCGYACNKVRLVGFVFSIHLGLDKWDKYSSKNSPFEKPFLVVSRKIVGHIGSLRRL